MNGMEPPILTNEYAPYALLPCFITSFFGLPLLLFIRIFTASFLRKTLTHPMQRFGVENNHIKTHFY